MECTVENCKSKILAKGYCSRHYKQIRKYGKILEDVQKYTHCTVKNCTIKHYAKGYCSRHYKQIRKYGKISRTHYDKNEIIIKSNFALIYLYNKKGGKISETKIDIEDVAKCKNIRWFLQGHGYADSYINGYLHHYISGNTDETDHWDNDRLNNQKDNLRKVTHHQNSMNRKLSKNNTTGFNGVCFSKQKGKFTSQIRVNNKLIYLGAFSTNIEAAKAYNKAAINYFGKYANLNKV